MASQTNRGQRGLVGGLLEQLARMIALLRASSVAPTTYAPETNEQLVRFDGLRDSEGVDRYWLNASFASAAIRSELAGIKHATTMLTISYVIFLAFEWTDLHGQVAAMLPVVPQ